MRSQSQIRQQLKQVTFRHLQKRLRHLFKKMPETCLHNYEVALDRDTGACVHLCGCLSPNGVPRNVPCDVRIPGCSGMARNCSLWGPLQTKDLVKADFQALLKGDRGAIAENYPDIAALLWVLDESGEDPVMVDVGEVDEPGHSEPEKSWWPSWIRRLGGAG